MKSLIGGRGWAVVGGLHVNAAKLTRVQRVKLLCLLLATAPLALMGFFGTFSYSRVGGGYALDIVTGRAAGPGARTTYLALLTAAPSDTTTLATMTETTMTGYARQSVAWSAPSAATPPESHNTGTLTWGPLSGSMATVTNFALVSASSGTVGDFLAYGALTTSRTPLSGDSLQAGASAFSLTCE